MHHFILATKDSWISSGSSKIDGTSFKDQNFGKDEIMTVKKEFHNLSFDHQTRALISFKGTKFTEMSQSIVNGTITNPKFYLRLYEAEGNAELSEKYKLSAFPLSESWDEGRGKFEDNPKVTNGVSWENISYPDNGTAITWSNNDGSPAHGGSIITASSSIQSFDNESPDVDMDITDIVVGWLSGSDTRGTSQEGGYDNYGLLLRFSGSQETDETTFGHLNFFSTNTNTIYAPRLDVRWDDSSFSTGSLLQITSSGLADNYLYMIGLRDRYKESEKVKFRVGARKRYIQKTFSTSVQTTSGSYIPEGSGSYSILDVATGETMIPFSAYTSMSCDSKSNYFIQWLDGFYPDRVYKIIYKLKYDDGQEHIFDNNFEFTIER